MPAAVPDPSAASSLPPPNQAAANERPDCDIFCVVVDNFGDIGVCWRLARQLAADRGWRVRLWVDDLRVFARLCPALDVQAPRQTVDGIAIARWQRTDEAAAAMGREMDLEMGREMGLETPAAIIIEAFGCDLPESYLNAMARRDRRPVWINLEYLSAEAWVAEFHLQPSPHPRLALLKTFFFPGLTPGTGGVLRERWLSEARRDFLAMLGQDGLLDPDLSSPESSIADASTPTSSTPTSPVSGPSPLWPALGMVAPPRDATLISLFGYENPALPALLSAWRDGAEAIVCVVPEGRMSQGVAHFLGLPAFNAGAGARVGRLTLHAVPFMDSALYDRLLWACDLNFVRGEDSFVRAQWAERPLVWHIYPQAEAAHLPKLDAALACYGAGLPASAREAQAAFWHAWNAGDPTLLDWPGFWRHRAALLTRAGVWAEELARLGDLAGNLAEFAENQLK